MKLSILTPIPGFAKEVGDLASLFFGDVVLSVNDAQAQAELTIVHEEKTQGGSRLLTVRLSGRVNAEGKSVEKVYASALEEKRYHKRQLKRCVYTALKQGTGIAPPWGSLTGIRPTRLVYEAMDGGRTLNEAAEYVRLHFDVSPPKASLLREIVAEQMKLPAYRPGEIDVYIGIPFCVSRCRYCSFLSGELGNGRQVAPYVGALLREIEAACKLVQVKGLRVRAFYMGGGTPTALPAAMLRQVLDAARPLMKAAEATVEAGRPDTLDEEKLRIIRLSGATRISINPQTMHDGTLAIIGRRHTRKQTEDAYALARKIGFDHINMDLIAGLPGETEAMFEQTLGWAGTLHPESLTIHTLSVKRSSLMHLWQDRLPDGAVVAAMVEKGRAHAARHGLAPYYLYRQKHQAGNLENVGYALPGHACLYNVDMMEDALSVLALGAGGISKRVWDGRTRIERAPNVKEVGHYTERVAEMIDRKKALFAN